MEPTRKSHPCSPYLRRPLRSLDQALKDQAATSRPDNVRPIKEFAPTALASAQRKSGTG